MRIIFAPVRMVRFHFLVAAWLLTNLCGSVALENCTNPIFFTCVHFCCAETSRSWHKNKQQKCCGTCFLSVYESTRNNPNCASEKRLSIIHFIISVIVFIGMIAACVYFGCRLRKSRNRRITLISEPRPIQMMGPTLYPPDCPPAPYPTGAYHPAPYPPGAYPPAPYPPGAYPPAPYPPGAYPPRP